jgi:hypothetical protein
MRRWNAFLRGWTLAAVLTTLAAPAHAVRLCSNVCTCNASCSLTCRNDEFVPTTCGASQYDCIDKCVVLARVEAAGQAAAAAPIEPAPDACAAPADAARVQIRE